MPCKKSFLKNFKNLTEKKLRPRLFLIKLKARRLQKETPAQVFPYEFC